MREKIAKWYKQGLWTARMVRAAALRGVITASDEAEILGGEVT